MNVIRVSFLSLALCMVSFGQSFVTDEISLRQELVVASIKAKITVDSENMFTAKTEDGTIMIASIQGFEQVPATALNEGSNIGFAYFNVQNPDIPKGFYTLRAYASVNKLGVVDSSIDLINEHGEVQTTLFGYVDVFSLTVPTNPAFGRVSFRTETTREMASVVDCICIVCSNGAVACICI